MIANETDRSGGRKIHGSADHFALRQADTGVLVTEVCRKMGVSEATYYNWNRGDGPQEVRRSWCSGASEASAAGRGPPGGGKPKVKTARGRVARHRG